MVVEKAEKRSAAAAKRKRAAEMDEKKETAAEQKRRRETISAAKRESKRQYQNRKKEVAEKEEENFRYLYIFRSDDAAWWKMGWRSVLFYRYIVAKRIGREANVNNDQDFGLKSPTGIVSLRDDGMAGLEKEMHALGYRLDRAKSWPGVKTIDLGYNISKEDLRRYEHEEEAKLERLNKLVPVVMNMPELDVKLYEIVRMLRSALRRMPEPDRNVLGYRMIESGVSMMRVYRYMAWGTLKPEEALKRIKRELLGLRTDVNVATRIEIINRDLASKLGVTVVEAERLLKTRLGEKADSAGAEIRKNESK